MRFAKVTIIDDAENGVWVTGLPAEVRVISTGQEYLSEGLNVSPVKAESQPS